MAEAGDQSQKKILIVDDEKPLAHAMSLKLSHSGFVVSIASDGLQALDALQKDKFDLMLLDIVMPNLNGFDVLQKLKEMKDRPPIVVMMSNLSQEEDQRKAKELGAIGYLVKSDTPLIQMINYVTNIFQSQL